MNCYAPEAGRATTHEHIMPSGFDSEQLAEAHDRAFETEADTAYFWAGEQYVAAYEAAEAAAADGAAFSFYPQERFTRALYFVWSRCLRGSQNAWSFRI